MVSIKNKSTHSTFRVFLLFFFVLGFLVCSFTLHAQASDGEPFAFTKLGQWTVEEDNFVTDVSVDGDTAFVCTTDYLAIIDVSDKTNPVFIQKFDQFGNYMAEVPEPVRVLVFGDYLFVIAYWHDWMYCWTNKIMVLDVSDLNNPTLVQEFNLKRLIYDICLIDNSLYVASSGDFRIYDIESPSAPYLLGNYSATGFSPSAIGIHGSYAFLGSYSDGYLVLDISNPSSPLMVKNSTDFSIRRMLFHDTIAFTLTRPYNHFSSSGYNFTVFNLTGSFNLEEKSRFPVSDGSWKYMFSDGYIYMHSFLSNTIKVFDVTNIASPEIVYQSTEEEFPAIGFSIIGNDFYLAAGYEGMIIFEVNYPPKTNSLNQSTFLIFFTGMLAFGIFLKRKRR